MMDRDGYYCSLSLRMVMNWQMHQVCRVIDGTNPNLGLCTPIAGWYRPGDEAAEKKYGLNPGY